MAFALLGWAAIVAIAFLLLARIGHVVTLLVLSALLAYLLLPAVSALERRMPRFAAMALVYLLAIGVVGFLGYFVVRTAAGQAAVISERARALLATPGHAAESPLAALLHRAGASDAQIDAARQQVTAHAEAFAGRLLPFLRGLLGSVLDAVLVIVLSAYLVIDGEKARPFLLANTPRSQMGHTRLLLDVLQRIVGGYVRGQLLLSTLIGLLVGVGMFLFRVPAAALLGVLAFLLAFVPILGTFVSGAACVLFALTRGWMIGLVVLGYFVVVHVLEGDILGPRIVGKALGIHPVVSIMAVIGGAELFGIKGALFGAPVVGFAQALAKALWSEWKRSHPEEFPAAEGPA